MRPSTTSVASSCPNRSYTADAISDVSMIMNQQAGFLCHWCCCEEIYESAVRVTFGDFDQLHNTASLRVSSIQNFQDEAGAQFGLAQFEVRRRTIAAIAPRQQGCRGARER